MPREYVLEFITRFAPHLGRDDVLRALAADTTPAVWPAVPHWREWAATVPHPPGMEPDGQTPSRPPVAATMRA